jgi:hypothetical protein
MKNFTTAVLALLLSASFGFAQKTETVQQKLFAEFPNSVEISKNTLADLFKAAEGQTVAVPFNEKFVFRGKVMSNQVKYANLQTMLLKYETGSGTLFQLSKITNKDNSVSYTGRIINPSALEVFEIKNDIADNYSLCKIGLDRILQDCSY